MKYKGAILICLIVCLFTIAGAWAGDANETATGSDAVQAIDEISDDFLSQSGNINEVAIMPSENENILNAQDNGTFTALQARIDKAAENSTIALVNDYSYDDGFDANGITLSKSLTLDGNGKTVDGKGKSRIFSIEPDTSIVLKNLILKNANTEGDGGAIYAHNANLTVTDCLFTNNLAQKGGAVCANESNVILSHDKFLKNQAMLAGGSIFARRANVDISNTLFEDSTAGGGGGLQILANGRNDVKARFENTIFKNTTATYTAGFFYTSNPTTVVNCTFENYNGNEYGAIVADNDLKLISSRFTNSYNVLGGAVSLGSDIKSDIINCIFENNRAQNGGAIYSAGHLTISASRFVANSAEYNGGAIYAENIASSTFDGDFTANTANAGGAIWASITDSVFNGEFKGNSALYGGAIYGNITDSIFNGEFSENAAEAGGAIYGNITDSIFNGDIINNTARNASLTMSEVLSTADSELLNFAPATIGAGGGIYGNVVGTTLNTNFVMNTANVAAVIAGNVERSTFTGKISQNHANDGIIISGDVIKSIFSGDISDISEIYGEISGDWIDSYIKKLLNEKEREQLEKLQNLTKEFEFEIESDLNIYADASAAMNPNNISVSYHFNLLNFVIDKTNNYDISKLKEISNPLDGPLGTIYDQILDELLQKILKDSPETDFTGSTAYLTMEIKTINNLKDATQVANAFGLTFKDKYFKTVKQMTLNELSVKIAPGAYRGDKNKGLEITTPYTLMKDGEGDAIIDAENNGNILTVKCSEIKIDGLTFMHASDSAIIFKQGLSDSVINANFIENTAGDSSMLYHGDTLLTGGGAIFIKDSVQNSVFKGNFIDNFANSGGAIYINKRVSDSIFSGNFSHNSADYDGSAIVTANIIDSTFSGNFIENNGASTIYAYGISGSTFSGNFENNERQTIYTYSISGSTFSGNFINNSVGVVFAILEITNSEFSGNFSHNSAGHGAVVYSLNRQIANSTFSGNFVSNSAVLDGGVIYGYQIVNSTFSGNFASNSAGNKGGAIYSSQPLLNSIFSGKFINNIAKQGGAICGDEIAKCTFTGHYSGNTAEMGNVLYAFHFYDYDDVNQNNRANIPESDIYDFYYESNKDSTLGVAWQNVLSCSNPMDNLLATSSNSIYVDGSASSDGNGSSYNPFNNLKSAIDNAEDGDTIYIYPGTYTGENNTGLTISKSLNLIKIGNDEAIFDAQNSGRIFTVDATSLNIIGLTFTHATDSAITFNADLETSMINADFKNNTNKAALYIKGRAINSIFAGNYIKNTADDDGAAIHADSFILCELKANFIENIATNGGAIAGDIISSTINGNFMDNAAANGGAIAGNIMKSAVSAKFTNNAANGNGGAIYGNVSSTNFTNEFSNNIAAKGGAIYGSVSSCSFRSDITKNHAAEGGVIYGSVSSSHFYCNFTNNTAEKGSILYCNGDVSKSVFNGKYADNAADENYGTLFYAAGNILDSSFLGEIFISNQTNIPNLAYSASGSLINCIFSNYTKEPDAPKPIDEKQISIPSLNTGSGTIKLPNDAEGTITLNIAGKKYEFPLVNGAANVKLPELANGNHKYIITYSGDSKYASFSKEGSVNIINPKITAKDTAVQYSAKGKYSVTVYAFGGKVASGVYVVFKIGGKQVAKVKTNAKGVASYIVTNNPGSYKISATALGKTVTKKLTVKHIVTLKTVKVKRSAKKLILQATVKIGKKPLANKRVTFKFNGKTYKAKTNKKGIAKVTIKKKVLKKLKKGKKITYQATYLKDTVKKTTKVKK